MAKRKAPSGAVALVRQSKAGVWYARWRDATGVRHMRSLKTTNEREAKHRADALEARLQLSPADPVENLPKRAQLTVAESTDDYIAHKRAERPDSRHARENIPASLGHFKRFIGPSTLCLKVRPEHLRQFSEHLNSTTLSRNTIVSVLNHVSAWADWCRSLGYVKEDLTLAIVRPPAPRRKPPQYLVEDEVRAAVKAARQYSPDGEGLVLIAVLCGLRASEICRLLWCDIDFRSRTLRVESHPEDAPRRIRGHQTKNETSRRTLPIEEPLLSWLIQHKKRTHGPYVFMHPPTGGALAGRLRGGLKVATDPAKISRLQRRLDHLREEENTRWDLTPPDKFEPYAQWPRKLAEFIRQHGCPRWDCRLARHTFATTIARLGQIFDREANGMRSLTIYDLQRLMGHASITTTERHYLAYFPQRIDLGLGNAYGLIESPTLRILPADENTDEAAG